MRQGRPPLEVTINGARGEEWERACGTRRFPVTTFNPVRVKIHGQPNVEVWMLNLLAIDGRTLERIFARMVEKFGGTLAEAEAEAALHGIPILAEDCAVVLNDPQRWAG